MSWVDEFGCRRVVSYQVSPVSPVDQLLQLISCQVDKLSVGEFSNRLIYFHHDTQHNSTRFCNADSRLCVIYAECRK
jgi:hypothetical protein